MKKKWFAVQFTIDGRLVILTLVLLLLLAAGAWSTRASPLSQDEQGLDANAVLAQVTEEPPAAALPGYEDANAGPVEDAQVELELPAFQDPNGDGASEQGAPADQAEVLGPEALSSNANGKLYYLTDFNRNANQALTACTAGYHMASLWELYDLSNLRYNTAHPDAKLKSDVGQGPPSLWYGWVRTGYDSSTSNIAGAGNCANWTSTTASHSGTILRLTNNWAVTPGGIGPWEPDPWSCSGIAPVWCIEN